MDDYGQDHDLQVPSWLAGPQPASTRIGPQPSPVVQELGYRRIRTVGDLITFDGADRSEVLLLDAALLCEGATADGIGPTKAEMSERLKELFLTCSVLLYGWPDDGVPAVVEALRMGATGYLDLEEHVATTHLSAE